MMNDETLELAVQPEPPSQVYLHHILHTKMKYVISKKDGEAL